MEQPVNSGRCSIQEDCSICLEDCDKENDFVTPCCRQVFHFECLMGWVTQKKNCPMCRQKLNAADLRQENERQIAARKERERLAREEEERQVQAAIRISIEQEEERQIQEVLKIQEQEKLKKQTCLASQSRETQITRLMKEQEEIIKNLNLSKTKAIEKLNHLRIEQQNLIRDRLQKKHLKMPATQQQKAQELLQQAILKYSVEGIKKAVHVGADVNKEIDGKMPIVLSVLLKKPNIVKELIECGVDLNVTYLNHSLVFHSLNVRDLESAFLLVKNGADISEKPYGCDLLYYGNSHYGVGHNGRGVPLELIQAFIDGGYNIFKENDTENIWSPIINRELNCLLYTRKNLKLGGVKLLIKNGANPNQVVIHKGNNRTLTPLLMIIAFYPRSNKAIINRCIEIAKDLLEAGADINQKGNPDGEKEILHTPLSFAIKRGRSDMINFLLEHGASL